MSFESPNRDKKKSSIDEGSKAHFFALVIGINNYQSQKFEKLTGAVPDADAVDSFLQGKLGVPKDQIRNLRNDTATREGIIKSFRDLQNDSRIKKGDTIFIYFAGHGSEKEAPDGWPAERGMVQLIVPQDTDAALPSGKSVNAIPDRTVAVLLDDLAHEKGNNIVVVLDCCHSSSGSRNSTNFTESIPRHTRVQSHISPDLDENILKSPVAGRSAFTSSVFLQHGLRSHVLLAACGAEENAWETRGHGDFTTALLKGLTEIGENRVTYRELVERMSLPRQHPHCEGYYKDSFLFNTMAPSADPSFIPVEKDGNVYVLKAGLAQGVTAGSEFGLYADRVGSESNTPLCTLSVKSVKDTQATLVSLPNVELYKLSKPAYARLIRGGSNEYLAVHFQHPPSGVDVKKLLDAIRSNEVDVGFITKDSENEAEFLVHFINESDGLKAGFSTTISRAKNHGLERLPNVVEATANDILRVLRSAARWHWHFKRQGSPKFKDKVHLAFYRLEHVNDEYDDLDMPVMRQIDEDLNHNGVVQLRVDPEHHFGVKIVNDTERDLYPYLFYFDISEQSIEPYSTGGDQVESPLPAGTSLTIGYGATGDVPLAFNLQDSVDVDVGFMKVFLTTSRTDFRPLKQGSPFASDRGQVPKGELVSKLRSQDWGTAIVAVVQRRASR